MAEFFELASVAPSLFCDGLAHVKDESLILKALEYSQPINGTITSVPGVYDIHGSGQVNESNVSASMGLVGLPAKGELIEPPSA